MSLVWIGARLAHDLNKYGGPAEWMTWRSHPFANPSLISPELLTKGVFELLFLRDNENAIEHYSKKGHNGEWSDGAKQHRNAKYDQNHAEIHGIARNPEDAICYKYARLFKRLDRGVILFKRLIRQ